MEQRLHVAATVLVALAVALIMTPAAYHRQMAPTKITESFLSVSTRLLLWSMPPLALGVCVDLYLIARIVLGGAVGGTLAGLVLAAFVTLWFVLPRTRALQRAFGAR